MINSKMEEQQDLNTAIAYFEEQPEHSPNKATWFATPKQTPSTAQS